MQIIPAGTDPDLEPLIAKIRDRLAAPANDEALVGAVGAAYAGIDGPASPIGRTLLTREWKIVLNGFGWHPIRIPLPPLQEVLAVTYTDSDGAEQTLPEGRYRVILGTPARLVPAFGLDWPSVHCGIGNVTIHVSAGYGDVDDIPEPILSAIALQARHAMSLAAQSLFLARENVEGVGERQFVVSDAAGNAIKAAVDNLLGPYRVLA